MVVFNNITRFTSNKLNEYIAKFNQLIQQGTCLKLDSNNNYDSENTENKYGINKHQLETPLKQVEIDFFEIKWN